MIRVYDPDGNVIETHEHAGRVQSVVKFFSCFTSAFPAKNDLL